MAASFATLQANPTTHHRLWCHAAIARLVTHVSALGGAEALGQFPFLESYAADMRAMLPAARASAAVDTAWLEALLRWEAALPLEAATWPLMRLRCNQLATPHLLALALAGLPDEDARFGPLYAALHPLPNEQRLTVGLLGDLLAPQAAGVGMTGWQLVRTLLDQGLLVADDRARPRAGWSLHVPGPIWDACRGERLDRPAPGMRYAAPTAHASIEELNMLLAPDLAARLARAPALLRAGPLGGLILRGMRGTGRHTAFGSVARALGAGVLALEWSDPAALPAACALLGPLCTLYTALPLLELDLAAGEAVALPPLPGYSGPVGIVLGREGMVHGPVAERCVTLAFPAQHGAARRACWQQALGSENGNAALIDQLGRRLHLSGGAIHQVAGLARTYAALDGRDHVALADVRAASRSLNRQALDALAVWIEAGGSWDDLVVSENTRDELTNLVLRCRQREAVLAHLGPGFGRAANRGVRVLFSGPSGTGKTLAARILAAELGIDLYRVDLAAVVDKYIGETERNLSRLFARAEEQDVLLLLDEGDSLLTGRTDVRSSNDRYANMETNYLLQRLETYEGILVVTTNAVNRIDRAFQRRMDVHVEFGAPDPAQRYRIWQLHLAREHQVGEPFLRAVAMRCSLSGGQIRNAALHATVLAVDQGASLRQEHLAAAIDREYRKLGSVSPLDAETVTL